MSSIRKSKQLLSAAALLALAAGCQAIVPPRAADPVNDPEVAADPALTVRDWEPKSCYYANGATIAGGTGYLWQVHETIPGGWRRELEAPVAVANIASMPVGVFVNSPFKTQVIRGETVPPTYIGNPPLP